MPDTLSDRLEQNRKERQDRAGSSDESYAVLREPERGNLNYSRLARQVDYMEHGAGWSQDFNHRVYTPSAHEEMLDMYEPNSTVPEKLGENYHGTSIGSIYDGCGACAYIRELEGERMNGWIIAPEVRLVRRVAKAPTLKDDPMPGYISPEAHTEADDEV